MNRPILLSTALLAVAGSALAQKIPVTLTYNFNGIVHANEAGNADDPNGFRSISDRALDFSNGVPNDSLLNNYQIVGQPGVLDIVHLGNRNSVSGNLFVFDNAPDGDDVGIQPAWLTSVDQSGPQTTIMQTPLPVDPSTSVAFIYQISNGGGTFDVTFTFASGNTYTAQLGGGDWFGGPYLGTQNVDNGFAGANLSVTEGRIDLSSQAGETATEITFSNPSSTAAGYAIMACNFEYAASPSFSNRIQLNCNFNGIAHAGEIGNPDDLIGYRSISDRGLNFVGGVPNDPLLNDYRLVEAPFALDIVHLGNRNTASGGLWAFQATANGDFIGVQPAWLPNVDQTGPQTTLLGNPIRMDASSSASLIFQISDGGGAFDVEFGFASGSPVLATVSGGDWFGGSLPGVSDIDSAAVTGANLNVTERTIDLSAEAGRLMTSITFKNATNLNAGHAIVGMNVVGCLDCANGALASTNNLGGGTGMTISTTSTGALGCDLEWTADGGIPNQPGAWLVGTSITSIPVALITPGCPGVLFVDAPTIFTSPLDANGSSTLSLSFPLVVNAALCGQQVVAQHGTLGLGPCLFGVSDALSITIGN